MSPPKCCSASFAHSVSSSCTIRAACRRAARAQRLARHARTLPGRQAAALSTHAAGRTDAGEPGGRAPRTGRASGVHGQRGPRRGGARPRALARELLGRQAVAQVVQAAVREVEQGDHLDVEQVAVAVLLLRAKVPPPPCAQSFCQQACTACSVPGSRCQPLTAAPSQALCCVITQDRMSLSANMLVARLAGSASATWCSSGSCPNGKQWLQGCRHNGGCPQVALSRKRKAGACTL